METHSDIRKKSNGFLTIQLQEIEVTPKKQEIESVSIRLGGWAHRTDPDDPDEVRTKLCREIQLDLHMINGNTITVNSVLEKRDLEDIEAFLGVHSYLIDC